LPMSLFRILLILIAAAAGTLVAGGQAGLKQGETAISLMIEGKGEVLIKLHTREAPQATAQVLKLTQEGFYNGQKFFRVVTEPRPFLVQFGDPQTRTKAMGDPSLGKGGTGAKIPFENSGFGNTEGSVALSAPQGAKDEGDSQFYINLANNRFLDGSYTVFGQVIKGMDIVKSIKLGDLVTSATVKRG
jgi:cyclophilin family peptidyl-prolyl cis-trans isomerase